MKHRLTSTARALRKNSTDAEHLMWRFLRNERFNGLKFRRQEPIGKYIVDFVCTEKNIVVELDGGQHGEPEQEKYDEQRTLFLQQCGYRVLRFDNRDVLNNTQLVLQNIYDACF